VTSEVLRQNRRRSPGQSSARIVIKVDSIDTGNTDRDGHLRSNDFFAMDEFPEITFTSTEAVKLGDDNFRLAGDLTVKGVTKPVTIDFEYQGSVKDPFGNLRAGFEGKSMINNGAGPGGPSPTPSCPECSPVGYLSVYIACAPVLRKQ
jgi:polyisoprenoid-binding protein YceI